MEVHIQRVVKILLPQNLNGKQFTVEDITLSDPDNPEKKVILTDGKFNINVATLNECEEL